MTPIRYYGPISTTVDLQLLTEEGKKRGVVAVGVSPTGQFYTWDQDRAHSKVITPEEARKILGITAEQVTALAASRGIADLEKPIEEAKTEVAKTEGGPTDVQSSDARQADQVSPADKPVHLDRVDAPQVKEAPRAPTPEETPAPEAAPTAEPGPAEDPTPEAVPAEPRAEEKPADPIPASPVPQEAPREPVEVTPEIPEGTPLIEGDPEPGQKLTPKQRLIVAQAEFAQAERKLKKALDDYLDDVELQVADVRAAFPGR